MKKYLAITNHAMERMHTFRLTVRQVVDMREYCMPDDGPRGKQKRSTDRQQGISSYNAGHYLLVIKDLGPKKELLITIYDRYLDLPGEYVAAHYDDLRA